MKSIVKLILICLACQFSARAQDSTLCLDKNYRPKVAEFGLETLLNYDINSSSERQGSNDSEIDYDRLLKFKIAAPIIFKKDRIFGVQLKYYKHRFFFDAGNEESELFSHLNNTTITNGGIRFFYQQDLNDKDKIRFVGGGEFKSDDYSWNANTTKYFVSGIWSRKLSKRTKIGTGIVFNRDIRTTSIYPVLTYERQLTDKLTLDLALPKSATLRKKINDSNYLIAKAEFKGWRYNLTNSIAGEESDLTIRKIDVQFVISWEREIHDWLWFQLDAGYTKNLRYYLAEPGGSNSDALVNINSDDTEYLKFSLFIVPPKKFYK